MRFQGVSEELMIYGMLFSLTNRIQTYGDTQFKDITMKQLFMMIALDMFGEHSPTLKEMGDLIGCSYQNIKRMALHLEKVGYLSIEHDSTDKRKLKLIATKKFAQLSAHKKDEANRFVQQLYHGIKKEQLKITMQTLIQMDKNIGGTINEEEI